METGRALYSFRQHSSHAPNHTLHSSHAFCALSLRAASPALHAPRVLPVPPRFPTTAPPNTTTSHISPVATYLETHTEPSRARNIQVQCCTSSLSTHVSRSLMKAVCIIRAFARPAVCTAAARYLGACMTHLKIFSNSMALQWCHPCTIVLTQSAPPPSARQLCPSLGSPPSPAPLPPPLP